MMKSVHPFMHTQTKFESTPFSFDFFVYSEYQIKFIIIHEFNNEKTNIYSE